MRFSNEGAPPFTMQSKRPMKGDDGKQITVENFSKQPYQSIFFPLQLEARKGWALELPSRELYEYQSLYIHKLST